MSTLEDHIVRTIKPFVEKGDLDSLQNIWIEYRDHTEFPREVGWDYVFQKVYLHAALKKQAHMCTWMEEMFQEFDPIVQIGMRQTFAYGRVLLRKWKWRFGDTHALSLLLFRCVSFGTPFGTPFSAPFKV